MAKVAFVTFTDREVWFRLHYGDIPQEEPPHERTTHPPRSKESFPLTTHLVSGMRLLIGPILNPRPNRSDLRSRQRRLIEWHLCSDNRGSSFNFVDQIAAIGIARIDAEERRSFSARSPHKILKGIINRVEHKPLLRTGTNVTSRLGTYRPKDVRLDTWQRRLQYFTATIISVVITTTTSTASTQDH
jgi:hypothetical protein